MQDDQEQKGRGHEPAGLDHRRVPTRYSAPSRIEEITALLRDDPGARLIAGGQSLLLPLLDGQVCATHLVDIRNVEQLRAVTIDTAHIFIGAGVCFSDLLRGPLGARLPALADALRHVGTTTIRNRATLGGNISWADPRAEAPMVLMVHDAAIITNRREIEMAHFPTGPFRTQLDPGEIIMGVRIPLHPDPKTIAFRELLDRQSAGKTVVSVALRADGQNVRFAVGGLFDRPVTATAPAYALDAALDRLARDHAPLADPFHSYAYRRAMAAILLHRVLAGP